LPDAEEGRGVIVETKVVANLAGEDIGRWSQVWIRRMALELNPDVYDMRSTEEIIQSEVALRREFMQTYNFPAGRDIDICPMTGLCTYDEFVFEDDD
jgi:hypothetical protein